MSVVGNEEEEEEEKESSAAKAKVPRRRSATSICDLSDYELGIVAAMVAGAGSGFTLSSCSRRLGMLVPRGTKSDTAALLRCRMTNDAFDVAERHGHSVPPSLRVSLAAANGNLPCLKRARETGCPWNARACAEAAGGGHLDCLKYLHAERCPWDEGACAWAAEGGHLDCLKYLHDAGCPE